MDPNENTPSEIYRNIRDKALEEAAELADKRPYGFTDLSREIRALKGNAPIAHIESPEDVDRKTMLAESRRVAVPIGTFYDIPHLQRLLTDAVSGWIPEEGQVYSRTFTPKERKDLLAVLAAARNAAPQEGEQGLPRASQSLPQQEGWQHTPAESASTKETR